MGYQEGNPFTFLEKFWRREMRESKRGRCFVSFLVFFILFVPLFGFSGEIAAQEPRYRQAWVKVPFCTTESVWSGEYRATGYRTIEIPFLDYRKVLVPGTGIWGIEFKKVPYTAYRWKTGWVNKIVSVARTRWEAVRRVVRRVTTLFERTPLGKLRKIIKVTTKPVTQWVKKTVWERVTRRLQEVFMEPYTAYTEIPVPVWIPPRTIRVPFTNYDERKIPTRERVMVEVPTGDVEWRWKLVNGKDIPVQVFELMFDRLDPCDPLEDRLDEIYETWTEFKGNLVAYSHDQSYSEELELFLDGLSPGEDYRAAQSGTLSNGFGEGEAEWEDEHYTADGYAAAQYFRIGDLAEDWKWANADEYDSAVHVNLCGELAVIAVVGDTVPHGLGLFNGLDFEIVREVTVDKGKPTERVVQLNTGADVLQNGLGTWDTQVKEFFEAYGWEAEKQTGDATADDLREELEAGRAVVALVELSTSTDATWGFLAESERIAAHWVSVLQVLHTRDGDDIVRIYNSFENREEYYDWEYFYDQWIETPYNSSVCLRVVAWEEEQQEQESRSARKSK
jgi:hypothetical protein